MSAIAIRFPESRLSVAYLSRTSTTHGPASRNDRWPGTCQPAASTERSIVTRWRMSAPSLAFAAAAPAPAGER